MDNLYINGFTSDNELYTSVYYNIFKIYGIYRKSEYQFIYDEFLEHLISDCIKFVEKNFNSERKGKLYLYKIEVFKKMFSNHINISSWSKKLMTPEKCPEIIRKFRINKLEKIKENYEN
jgi:hypothetical protein